MNRHSAYLGLLALLATLPPCALTASAAGAAQPQVDQTSRLPNIIFILADDMGYGDCSAYNSASKIQTPNLDRLASEGLLFTDAHSASGTCTASRYGLLTGINPARRGVVNGINQLGPVLEEHEVTVAELLKNQGYATKMVGKWHLGFDLKPAKPRATFDFTKPLTGGPLDHGFDSLLGLRQAVSSAPYFWIRDREAEAAPTETTAGTVTSAKAAGKNPRTAYGPGPIAPGFVPEEAPARLSEEVVATIRGHAAYGDNAKPLFLYYAMLQPHTPWIPEKRFDAKSEAGPYGDYIVQLDHEVGRLLDALAETGLDQHTLIIFSSDNGSLWPEADIERWGHRANGPLAGGKARPEEGGHRVPFIARWPGVVPAGKKTDATINHTDFLATLADLFELDLAKTAPEAVIDSHSFLSVLRDPKHAHNRPAMSVTAGSFRQGEWKLTFDRGPRSAAPDNREASQASLYNLATDLGETTDLSSSQPERKEQLFAAYRDYFADLKLKPLAKIVAAKKNQKKKSPAAPKRAPTELTPAQEALDAEYKTRRSQLLKQQTDLLTPEQKKAADAGRKKALAEGLKGAKLRNAIDAAANLTPDQRKQLAELREETGRLTRARREQHPAKE